MEQNTEKVSGYAWYALALLMFVYILNFLDRVLIFYLFKPLQDEFNFSYLQLSLLGSTAFVIFYTLLGIPFGRLADTRSRKNMIAIGLAVWSLFSGLTGFATDFWTLFFCRLMVGVGEATLGPAAISLLADYFPARLRATVASIYSMGIAIGAGLAAFFGGWLGEEYGWRAAFYFLGFPGLLLAVLVFFLREEKRGRTDVSTEKNYSAADWKVLFRTRPLIFHYVGYGLLGLAANNLTIWGASFYGSVHGVNLKTLGYNLGFIAIAAGIPATLFGGYIADWFRRRQPGGRMLFTALLTAASVPFWLMFLFSSSVNVALAAQFCLVFVSLAWLGAAAADVMEIAGANLRGLGVGIYFFTVNFSGYVVGANIIGQLNDYLAVKTDPQMMRFALLVCPIAALLSAICLWFGSRSMAKLQI